VIAGFFRIFFAAIPKEIADATVEKMSEKESESEELRKTRSRTAPRGSRVAFPLPN